MGRPLGAENKDKPFRQALRMEMAAAKRGDECYAKKGSLRWIARQLLERAGQETAAVKEIADRLDGKALQQTILSGDANNPLRYERIEDRIIDVTSIIREPIKLNGGSGAGNGKDIQTPPNTEPV